MSFTRELMVPYIKDRVHLVCKDGSARLVGLLDNVLENTDASAIIIHNVYYNVFSDFFIISSSILNHFACCIACIKGAFATFDVPRPSVVNVAVI